MELSDEARKKQREYKAKWRAKNKDKVNQYFSEWKKANRDKIRAANARYWEKKAMQDDSVTKKPTGKIIVTEEPGQAICINCGEFFQPKRKTAKYCSDVCRVRYNRRVRK